MKIIIEIYCCLEKRKPQLEMERTQDIHLIMNIITEEEYDEFVELFLDIYCPDATQQPLQRIVSLTKMFKYPIKGCKFDIPEKKLVKTCSQIVDVVLHPKKHDLIECDLVIP